MASTDPAYAAISCGVRNEFGHSAAETLKRDEDARILTLPTDTPRMG